jgi:choline dehydrogenase-like flavoprotein
MKQRGDPQPMSGARGICVPRFQNLGTQHEDYARGFGMIGWLGRMAIPKPLRKKAVGASPTGLLCVQGECLPKETNRVSLDKHRTDQWGVPIAHVEYEWCDNDLKMANAMETALGEMVDSAGGKVCEMSELVRIPLFNTFLRRLGRESRRITVPGLYVHEVGGARMGTDPRKSVLNACNQSWDVKNLFVLDGASWPSGGWQNPTLTLMAVAARASRYIGSEIDRGNI